MPQRTSLLLCLLPLLTGFLVVCLGAFFFSAGSLFNCQENLTVAYLLLPLGFVILLGGIFWSTYRQASKSKRLLRHVLRRRLTEGDLALATVDRPDFYPPAYEESFHVEKMNCGQASGIPPPLYTETSLDVSSDIEAQPEAPPPYEASMTDMTSVMSKDTVGQIEGC
ncbi:transmembrane protein 252 [Rhynchocyon petersi]